MKNSKTFITLVTSLVSWFDEAARPLPWRKNPPNPYEIWISEIMSQQSTLKMMLPYFDRWMKCFPTLKDLAYAEEAAVLKNWEGLGYYSRARNVHKAAKFLHFNFPKHPSELIKLPGIGPYTAAAIAAIAFDYPSIPVDGNVTRVFSRFFGIQNPFGSKEDAQSILKYAEEISPYVPKGKRGAFAQSLMELGALVCKPGHQAKCDQCPLVQDCVAQKRGMVEQWPLPKLRPKMKQVARVLLLYRGRAGALLLRQRPTGTVLGGQWEIPYLDLSASKIEVSQLFSGYFEGAEPFKHTIMNTQYLVWPLELGQWRGRIPQGHIFDGKSFRGALTTITRKFMAKSLKK